MKRRFLHRAVLVAALLTAPMAASLAFFAPVAWAINPEDQLDDPALEKRARIISRDLRCMVCAGQTIDESPSPVAQALRKMVRERLLAGDTNKEVFAAVELRYGEQVLLRPRFSARNFLLWTGPFIVLIFGGFAAWRFIRASALAPEPAPLSDEDRAALENLKSN